MDLKDGLEEGRVCVWERDAGGAAVRVVQEERLQSVRCTRREWHHAERQVEKRQLQVRL